nr:immunoglobulin light chain junction region [Macaca mulatta]
CQHGFGVPYSF